MAAHLSLALALRVVQMRSIGQLHTRHPLRLPLDRVLCDGPSAVRSLQPLRDAAFRVASDHLPVLAWLAFRPGATSG